MAEQKQDAVRVDWCQSVSWLALFRGFRIALDVKKMILGFVALVATYGAFVILVAIWAEYWGGTNVSSNTSAAASKRIPEHPQSFPAQN